MPTGRNATLPSLMPTRGDDALELRLLLWGTTTIDSSVPAQAGSGGEPGHRLDQLIDLRAEQCLPARLDRLYPIGRADIPALHGDLLVKSMNRQPQIVRLSADDEIQWIDARVVENLVGRAAIVLKKILPIAAAKEEGIVAGATVNSIVPQTATQGIVASIPVHGVIGAGAGKCVSTRIADDGKSRGDFGGVHVQCGRVGGYSRSSADHHAFHRSDSQC